MNIQSNVYSKVTENIAKNMKEIERKHTHTCLVYCQILWMCFLYSSSIYL